MNILKEWQRMCRAMSDENDDCLRDCPIVGTCPLTTTGEHFTEIDIRDMEREITEWVKANSPKTCLDDFKEKFPNMRQTMEPWPNIHPWNLGYDVPRDMKAKEAWYSPMEEQAMEKTKEALKLELERVKREREQPLKLAKKGQKPAEREWPQRGDLYYCVDTYGDIVCLHWGNSILNLGCFYIGNMFRTEGEAEWYSEHLKVCAELRRMADGSIEDGIWFELNHNIEDGVSALGFGKFHASPYIFASCESAQKAIDTIGEERLKKYWFRVEG